MIDTQSNIGGFGGSPIPIPVVNTNIYNSDGTLTANRVVTGGGFTLTFAASQTRFIPSSNLAGDITFGVRDFADTTYNFYVAGNGNILGNGGLADLSYSSGVKVNFLRTNTWNDVNSSVNLVTWDFGGTGIFQIYKPTYILSPSASSLDTAFSVRNNTNTLDMLKVLGNGDTAIGNIGNTGARLGVKGVDNSASTYNTLLTNLAGDFLFQLDNDGGLRTNLGNYRQFKFGNDNYFETVGGSAYYRGNGFGYFNVNLIGGINFESSNFGGGQAHASAKVQIESTTQGFRLVPMTATQASAITPSEGLELNVSNTNGTFTSIGKWQYIGGAWVKL